MSGTGFTFSHDAFDQYLRAEKDRVDDAAGAALYGEAQLIMTDSKEHYVPVETSTLKNSGFVDEPEIGSDGIINVQLSYGGFAFAYALYQHERLDLHHTVGQAKYLETPFHEAENGMDERLAEAISQRLGR